MNGQGVNRRTFITTLAGAALTPAVRRAAADPPARLTAWPSVQAMVDAYVADGRLPGAAAALSFGGSPLAFPSAGRIAFDSPVRFDEGSVCRIYSMSKPVTGAAAMMLVEDGRLTLDQPVATVLPEFGALGVALDLEKGTESRPATKTMTMRHLLTHTSGLGYWTPQVGHTKLAALYRERGITPGNYGTRLDRPGFGPQAKGLEDMVRRVAELPLASEPGTVWSYSIGLDVMGLVIERVSRKPFAAFLRERLFAPLEMHSTGFQVRREDAARLTTNYNVTPEGLRPTDAAATSVWLEPPTLPAGGGGLVSSARDFSRFGEVLLGDGKVGSVRVMRAETARLMRSNLLPPGVTYAGGGFGAGARVSASGRMDWGGAAGTLWIIDPVRGGNMVFMSQHMPPETYPLRPDFEAAIEADLRRGTARP